MKINFNRFILLFSLITNILYSQTNSDYSKAASFYKAFVQESKRSDIESAFQHISNVMANKNNHAIPVYNFMYGIIAKQYTETINPTEKSDYIYSYSNALYKTIVLDSNFEKKTQVLKMLQIIGYDLYNDGVKLFNANKNESAQKHYKLLLDIQKLLSKNNLNFDMEGKNGQKLTLTSSDILNNFVVFSINSGKSDEAKLVFENEVKTNPSQINYARLIQLCNQLGDASSSEKYINEGIKLYPNDEDLLIFSINLLMKKQENTAALTQIDKAIMNHPSPMLYLVKSQVYDQMEKFDKSVENLKEAIKIYPNNFDINYTLGHGLFNASLREINKQDPMTKGVAMNMIKESKELFLKAKSIDPTRADFDKIISNIDSVK